MNASISLKFFEITKEFVAKIEETIDQKFDEKTEVLATKNDIMDLEVKVEKRFSQINQTIYIVGLVQFLAIVGSVLAIVNFMIK